MAWLSGNWYLLTVIHYLVVSDLIYYIQSCVLFPPPVIVFSDTEI